ncbi:HofP DNA utilization family protein [Izhakiella capsodis]|uniref:HofP DNA utilization family protein n=1 Tax=Izhakiella capsodis TaxID=1367852 RepID=UPI000B810DAE|nr:HofP DNA utilization family protein [Izhakiella capsodis]
MNRFWLLLLMFCNGVQGRDPFLPPEPSCVSHPSLPTSWQLLGVIGSEGHFVSRWQSPLNYRITLAEQASLSQTNWRIVQVELTGVTLVWQGQCQAASYFYSLKKGRFNAYMDVAPAADSGEKRSGSRADGFSDIQRGAG